jgi:hypothetical protein
VLFGLAFRRSAGAEKTPKRLKSLIARETAHPATPAIYDAACPAARPYATILGPAGITPSFISGVCLGASGKPPRRTSLMKGS